MEKTKFIGEFEFRASRKMLYPYLNTAGGLAQWFADDVKINEDKDYIFVWDGKEYKAKLTAVRLNNHVRFEFLPDNGEEEDSSYVDFRLDENELTQSVYLKVIDYSDTGDAEELEELWESMVITLKEITGG